MTTLRKIDLSKDGARGLLVLDDRKQATATKRTRDPQQVDGFQNTGFATAVCAVEDIDTRGGERVTGCRLRTPVTETRLRDI